MTINNNPMNPVPLWTRKNYWQCNQPTFHDAMAWPVLPKGTLPKMALTVKGTLPSSTSRTVTLSSSGGTNPTPARFIRSYAGSVPANPSSTITLAGQAKVDPGQNSDTPPYPNIIITKDGANYTMKFYVAASLPDPAEEYPISRFGGGAITKELLESGNGIYTFNYNSYECRFTLSAFSMDYTANVSASIVVKKFIDNSTVATTSQTAALVGCGVMYSSDRMAQMWIGGQALTGTFTTEAHYMEVTVDGTTYYSEPFMWLDSLASYTLVTYRRSVPVTTTENHIVFKDNNGDARSLTMYLPNIEQRPPYQFDVEVTEIDGRKYAEKQVSYRKDRIAFHCYEAFMEAVRLLWHCDIRYVGTKRIDYMEPPEVDWNSDNHLCDVVLEMESDTVVQTNGNASAYIDSSDTSHTAYDGSFDQSFD